MNVDRFFKFVNREDDHGTKAGGEKETAEEEMAEVKSVLTEWAGPLLRLFNYYAFVGGAASNLMDTSAFCVLENCYHQMCIELELVDSEKCTKSFLSRCFVQVSIFLTRDSVVLNESPT